MKVLTTIIKINIVATFIINILLVFLTSCGETSNISTVGNPTSFELPSGEKAFYSPAVDTTPVITATTEASSSLVLERVSTAWESGNPAYEVFNAFQDYQYPRDEGVIDVSNIYKLLFEAGTSYDNALNEVVELTLPTTISPPFDFGNEAVLYTHAALNSALALDGETVHALLTWIWDENPKFSYGIIEGSFNETTGDLTLDMVYLVDYESDGDYCLRTTISGNEGTHTFTLKAAKYNAAEDGYAISMIGTGISQSESDEDYFLLKIIDNNNLSEYSEGRYYKFSSSADEDNLMAHPINGYDLTELDDPNNYAETLDAMTFFALDGSNHATSVDDFSNSNLELDY